MDFLKVLASSAVRESDQGVCNSHIQQGPSCLMISTVVSKQMAPWIAEAVAAAHSTLAERRREGRLRVAERFRPTATSYQRILVTAIIGSFKDLDCSCRRDEIPVEALGLR